MNESESTANNALSGWAGVGTSSLTLLLAVILKKEYYPITEIFRTLDKILGQGEENKALRVEFEQEIQPNVGKTLDKYVDHLLLNKSNIILESDIAAFRIGKNPKVFSVFIKASMKTRKERTSKEGRAKKETSLKKRDTVLKEEYIKLWNIDIFDDELIDRKHNLVINNDELGFEEELMLVYTALEEHPAFKNAYDWDKLKLNIEKDVKRFWKEGKEGYKKRLKRSGLNVSTEKMMQDMVAVFPEDLEDYPERVQKIFLGQT